MFNHLVTTSNFLIYRRAAAHDHLSHNGHSVLGLQLQGAELTWFLFCFCSCMWPTDVPYASPHRGPSGFCKRIRSGWSPISVAGTYPYGPIPMGLYVRFAYSSYMPIPMDFFGSRNLSLWTYPYGPLCEICLLFL